MRRRRLSPPGFGAQVVGEGGVPEPTDSPVLDSSRGNRRGLLHGVVGGVAAAFVADAGPASAHAHAGNVDGGASATTVRLRRGTTSRWRKSNPILARGEPGVETNTGRLKIGDGKTRWNKLSYFIDEISIAAAIRRSTGPIHRAIVDVLPAISRDALPVTVQHGWNRNAARPPTTGTVSWIGWVQPVAMKSGDILYLIRTSPDNAPS